MKSFKLIYLQIVTEDSRLIDIPLADGLIINKENDISTWLLEAFVAEKHFHEFASSLPDIDGEVTIQAVITKKDNEPALFDTVLRTIKKVDGHYSLLFVGHIKKNHTKYAELLLEDLVYKGLEGEELIREFKEKIKSRPKLATYKSSIK